MVCMGKKERESLELMHETASIRPVCHTVGPVELPSNARKGPKKHNEKKGKKRKEVRKEKRKKKRKFNKEPRSPTHGRTHRAFLNFRPAPSTLLWQIASEHS